MHSIEIKLKPDKIATGLKLADIVCKSCDEMKWQYASGYKCFEARKLMPIRDVEFTSLRWPATMASC